MCSSWRAIQLGTLGLLMLAFMIVFPGSRGVYAQQDQAHQKQTTAKQGKAVPQPQTTAAPTPASKGSRAIDIKIETFRKQIAPGTAMGVTADFTNNSESTVYLRQRDVQLVLPPDVEGGIDSTDGWFPTEYCLENCPKEAGVIALRPAETYRVFWGKDARTTGREGSWFARVWRSFRYFINFTPGVYSVTVEAKYWDKKEELGGDNYHTAVETKDAEFVAPQAVILWGAALGGLIFTTLSMIRRKEKPAGEAANDPQYRPATWGMGLLIVAGSILLSVIITILLSRIEQTQFFIKVTVSDFWGAIAVGFLANYGGWKLLDKMVGEGQKEAETPGSIPKAKPASAGQ